MATFLITSTLMVIAVLTVRFLFKNKLSFLILYPLWGLVLIRLLIPVNIIESPVSIMNIASTLNSSKNPVTAIQHEKGTNKNFIPDIKNQPVNKQEKEITINNKKPEDNITSTEKINKQPEKNVQDNKAKYKSQDQKENLTTNNTFIKFAIIIWVLGSSIFFICIILSNLLFYRKLKEGRILIYTNNKNIPVYISDIINTPCLTGIFKPSVYLPGTFNSNIQDKYLKQVLAHEYTHIKHKDNIWALMRTICLGIYWFNPFVWIAAFYSKQDAELACDEAVLRNCTNNERYDYGKMLLTVSQKSSQGRFFLATSLGSSKNNLKERLTMITKKRKPKKYHIALTAAFSVILAGCGMTNGSTSYINKNQTGNKNQTATNPVDTVTPVTINTKEPVNDPATDNRIKAFETFMKKDVLSRPEWISYFGAEQTVNNTRDLYFSIQYTKDNIPLLFVTERTFDISDDAVSSSHANVYYYDTDSKNVEFLTFMACSSSGETVSITDGVFVTNTHHSYRAYKFNSQDNKLEAEEIEGYYIFDDDTDKQSDNFTYTKYEWQLPISNSQIKQAVKKGFDNYTYNKTKEEHYNVPEALDFASKYSNATPINYYKNKPAKWDKFYKDKGMVLNYTYGVLSGNIDNKIQKSLNNIKDEDFKEVMDHETRIINEMRMTYCGSLIGDTALYYLNARNGARAILTYTGAGHYWVHGIIKAQKGLDDGFSEINLPELFNGDFDNDGEDETAFYIEDQLYIVKYNYDYSYEDYNIITSSVYEIYTFTKDNARYFTEQFCKLYDENPKQLGTETLTKIKTINNNKNFQSKKEIMSGGSVETYGYTLSGGSLSNNYEFGYNNSYDITTENGKPAIKTSITIRYYKKGDTKKQYNYIKLEAGLQFNDSEKYGNEFTLIQPFLITMSE